LKYIFRPFFTALCSWNVLKLFLNSYYLESEQISAST
jgi:hypothetical protein